MSLQWIGQRCAANQAVNPETGACYNVCPKGQVYDPQGGCGDANWFVRHKFFVTLVSAGAIAFWWKYLR